MRRGGAAWKRCGIRRREVRATVVSRGKASGNGKERDPARWKNGRLRRKGGEADAGLGKAPCERRGTASFHVEKFEGGGAGLGKAGPVPKGGDLEEKDRDV